MVGPSTLVSYMTLRNEHSFHEIHSDSDDYYNGGPVSLDPQWHVKEPWRC